MDCFANYELYCKINKLGTVFNKGQTFLSLIVKLIFLTVG